MHHGLWGSKLPEEMATKFRPIKCPIKTKIGSFPYFGHVFLLYYTEELRSQLS